MPQFLDKLINGILLIVTHERIMLINTRLCHFEHVIHIAAKDGALITLSYSIFLSYVTPHVTSRADTLLRLSKQWYISNCDFIA
jgi:hypothetical protein